ncbi:MAG: thioesterase family protein [Myxococcota bacterium]
MSDAFYLREGDAFRATVFTRGPWSRDHQHAGPPSALLARALEAATKLHLVRITVEIERPIPIGRLETRAEVARPGKRVEFLDGELLAEGKRVARCRGLAVRETELVFGELPPPPRPSIPSPEDSPETCFPFFRWDEGYHRAMEQRRAHGDWGGRSAGLWMRPRVPLVAGEMTSPMQRVVIAADSNNGVANVLDKDRFVFINPDLTVTLFRAPVSDWVCLDAVSYPQPEGWGMAESLLLDEEGPIGRSTQSLLVDAAPK